MSKGLKCLINPDSNINTAIPFKIIKALSFHSSPTHSQPDTPTRDKHKSTKGYIRRDLTAKAQIKKALDTHLTYRDRSCLGVALL